MSMITRIGFSTRTLNSNIRAINGQVFRQPKEWSRLQRLGDSILNIIDGYKPVVVKGIDNATGKKVALRDDKGRKLINWVRNIKKDNFVIRLPFLKHCEMVASEGFTKKCSFFLLKNPMINLLRYQPSRLIFIKKNTL